MQPWEFKLSHSHFGKTRDPTWLTLWPLEPPVICDLGEWSKERPWAGVTAAAVAALGGAAGVAKLGGQSGLECKQLMFRSSVNFSRVQSGWFEKVDAFLLPSLLASMDTVWYDRDWYDMPVNSEIHQTWVLLEHKSNLITKCSGFVGSAGLDWTKLSMELGGYTPDTLILICSCLLLIWNSSVRKDLYAAVYLPTWKGVHTVQDGWSVQVWSLHGVDGAPERPGKYAVSQVLESDWWPCFPRLTSRSKPESQGRRACAATVRDLCRKTWPAAQIEGGRVKKGGRGLIIEMTFINAFSKSLG